MAGIEREQGGSVTPDHAAAAKQAEEKVVKRKGLFAGLVRPQGDDVSFVKVGDFKRDRLEYEVVRVDALYFYAACADENLPRYHARYLNAKAVLQYLQDLNKRTDAADPKIEEKIAQQKETVKALYTQYRHMSHAARHYMHYRMYESVMELIARKGVKTTHPKRRKELEKILSEYHARFEGTEFNFYLRKVSELAALSVSEGQYAGKTFGDASDPFVLYNPITKEVLDPKDADQALPLDFMSPGLKIFNTKKNLATYIQHFDAVHHNVALPVEARIQLWHLNDHQAENVIKDAEKWKSAEHQQTRVQKLFGGEAADEEQDCSYEITDSSAPALGSQFVSLERPLSPTQKWVGRIGLALNFGFTLLGMIGIFAGLSMMIPLWPAAAITGVLFIVDLLRNKDDFYDQLLRWAKQYETTHPYKTGFHYKGLMQTTGKRAFVSMMLRALVGLEFFAVAVPGGMGLVENGKGVFSRLFGQLNKNNTWYQLINPLFYLVAIGCVMISFFVPATAWTDYWGLHGTEVKPEHRYNHERTKQQLEHSTGYGKLFGDHRTITEIAEAQDRNEFHFESSDDECANQFRDTAECPAVLVKYEKNTTKKAVSMDKRDVDFELAREKLRLAM